MRVRLHLAVAVVLAAGFLAPGEAMDALGQDDEWRAECWIAGGASNECRA
jgi:hypothetical protein